jgi:hypothetical protein
MIASRPMRARRLSLVSAGAVACASLALWTSFGAITFVDADPLAARVGVLPPLSWLPASAGLFILVAIIHRRAPRYIAPLWLSAFLLLPWLPLPTPTAVLIWAGALRWWLWAGIAGAILAPLLGHAHRSLGSPSMRPRPAALAAGLVAVVAYGIGAWAVSPVYPVGDEPHYLVIAQSLIKDHDLQIENNHRRGDYLAYHSAPLKPDYLRRGTNGQIYSVHAPGLPFLIAPVFAAFGYTGVRIALVLFSGGAAALAWLLAWRVTSDAAATWFAWAAVAFSVPFFFHAFAVYPDGVAAALMLVGALPLVDARWRERPRIFLVGVALAALPWLHTRFALAALTTAIVIVGRLVTAPEARTRIATFFAAPVVSLIGWLAFFKIIYGTPNPTAPYGGANQSDFVNTARGIPGLLIDHQFGLLTNAPVYLCAIAGVAVMLARGRRRLAVEIIIMCAPYLIAVAAFQMWWAGYSAPARFLVPTVLLLVVPTASWFALSRSKTARVSGAGLLFLSLLITFTLVAVQRGATLFNVRDGVSRLALWLSPAVNFATALPSLFRSTPMTALLQASVWTVPLAAAFVLGRMLERRGWTTSALVATVGSVWAAGAITATEIVWRSTSAMPITPGSGGVALLRNYDPDQRQIALSYSPFARLALANLPQQITLANTQPSLHRPGEALAVLSHAPAAVYALEGVVTGGRAGRLRVRVGGERDAPPLFEWNVGAFERAWRRTVVLPVAVETLRLEADAAARDSISHVSMRAIDLPGSHRWPGREVEAFRAARYGSAMLFLTRGRVYMEHEGLWVAGRQDAEFVVAPDEGSPIRLFVRNTATENHVTLQSGRWRQELALQSREERIVDVPSDPGRAGILLSVAAATGARPIDFEAKSGDERLLGCWIETR